MRVCVIHPDSGWILSSIARKMCEALPRNFLLGEKWMGEMPEAYYYVDVQNCWHPRRRVSAPNAKHVGMFTHLDRDSVESFRPGWEQLDGVVHMATRYRDAFLKWYPPERMTVLIPGEPTAIIPPPRIKLGVVQRGGFVGKGASFLPLVLDTLTEEERSFLHVRFCGDGWSGAGRWPGLEVDWCPEDQWFTMPNWYDYLWVPSLWEGGPMAVLEALAAGKRIIASGVGFVADVMNKVGHQLETSWYRYQPGDVAECAAILGLLVGGVAARRRVVEPLTYKAYGLAVAEFIAGLSRRDP